ncbi:MAG: bifunctional adenosylcobinamide kinase/adenosylcobinamide-phosphate guanylyltransferase [Opitutales bacterium]|nr:bifunctional adenosylcobinamide kinase/adenosylcobinamide-phosphate guanylyltransferase [Opitutales bacterium]
MNKGSIHLIFGGSRSGKSRFAENTAAESGNEVFYVATCRTSDLDAEMQDRIRRHREQRPTTWETVENIFDFSMLAKKCAGKTMLLDCLTMWLGNALEVHNGNLDAILEELEQGLNHLKEQSVTAVIVSNEVGMGIVPMGGATRAYRDLVGWANQKVASHAETVDFIAAGCPLRLKGSTC